MKIIIIYASTSGNVEAVCDKVGEILTKKGFEVELNRAEQTGSEKFNENAQFILATSTWEHGEINPFFNKILKEMNGLNLKGKKAYFVGLGDRRYEPVLFAEGVEILKREFSKQGGEILGDTLKIDGEPFSKLDSTVTEWTNLIADQINNEKENLS